MLQLAVPWVLYEWTGQRNQTLARSFLDGAPLIDVELRTYAESALAAPFSFHEVEEVDPGRGLQLRDLLAQERAYVVERSGSRSLRRGSLVFGKIVQFAGVSTFDGLGPTPIEPTFRNVLLNAAKRLLGPRRRRFTPVDLREHGRELLAICLYLEARVRETAQARGRPRLLNTDGEPLAACETRYAFEPRCIDELAARIDDVDAFEPRDAASSGERTWVWLRGAPQGILGGRHVLGTVSLRSGELIVECNSHERHERLRRLVESVGQSLLRFTVTSEEAVAGPAALAGVRDGRWMVRSHDTNGGVVCLPGTCPEDRVDGPSDLRQTEPVFGVGAHEPPANEGLGRRR